jgi:hypothetical protein
MPRLGVARGPEPPGAVSVYGGGIAGQATCIVEAAPARCASSRVPAVSNCSAAPVHGVAVTCAVRIRRVHVTVHAN